VNEETTCNIHGVDLGEDASGNEPVIHVVKTDQTISDIAEEYGKKPKALEEANPNIDIDDLTKGQRITIPINQGRSNGWIGPSIIGLILILFKRKRKINLHSKPA